MPGPTRATLALPTVTRARSHLRAAASAAVLLAGLLTACGGEEEPDADVMAAPAVGECRDLTARDLSELSNTTETIDCAEPHTAETFLAGEMPPQLTDRMDPAVDRWAFTTCSDGLETYLGADESLVMRSVLSWVFFRPTEEAWEAGARWFRCDVVAGGTQGARLLDLPTTVDGLFASQQVDDRWMACAKGPSVDEGTRVPCSKPHDWRAVTTIRLGEAGDPYPGDESAEQTTQDYCADSVGAWLGYPADYDFGYTWFGEPEWEAGNRRSVCWARTTE